MRRLMYRYYSRVKMPLGTHWGLNDTSGTAKVIIVKFGTQVDYIKS